MFKRSVCDELSFSGLWQGFRDCHIKADLILIYRYRRDALELVRLGSHSDLFKS
ncbi:type II toxin-antitoxin system mRNA interferase toxin, RelE/StbE family [Helicobacter felistomachi]|uniref:type II toxin-antitoxin system mRNA interferase toxin, RelE/StbE family n=1 Tax=Helicobacter felistomachi TaxID=3040201 RepID=UPI003369FC79